MQQFSITLMEYMDRWQVQISEWRDTDDEWGLRRDTVASVEFWSQGLVGIAALQHVLWETQEFLAEQREALHTSGAKGSPTGGSNTISECGESRHHVVGWTEAGGAEEQTQRRRPR